MAINFEVQQASILSLPQTDEENFLKTTSSNLEFSMKLGMDRYQNVAQYQQADF